MTADLEALDAYVRARVRVLQAQYFSDVRHQRAEARRLLAEFRRARAGAPQDDFDASLEIFRDLPEVLHGRGDQASSSERAAHAALVLYAQHQQGSRGPVHANGVSLGRAVGLLAGGPAGEENPGVLRRFKSVAAATTFDEAVEHASTVISLMGSAERPVALDYGRLARDLLKLQVPGWREGVQLAWARDYHHREERSDNQQPATEGASA